MLLLTEAVSNVGLEQRYPDDIGLDSGLDSSLGRWRGRVQVTEAVISKCGGGFGRDKILFGCM